MQRLRDSLKQQHGYQQAVRIGAAGGLGTPSAVAAAFALGADYVVAGSVNQSAIESGLSAMAKSALAETTATDMAMVPSGDVFLALGELFA